MRKLTTEEFIQKAKSIHGDKYDYSLVDYIGSKTNVIIICEEHGKFYQQPNSHITRKAGCPKCANIRTIGFTKYNNETFIKKAKTIHGKKFDYSNVNYINQYTNITIKCSLHGEFFQRPHNHINGYGCPKCKMSKGELLIERYLTDNNIKFIRQCKFKDCKNKRHLPFDFYLPNHNLCIEYDGKQHNQVIDYWGGIKTFKQNQLHDKIKNKYCLKNNIDLIRIPYSKNFKNVLSTISSKLSFILKRDCISL